MLLLFFSQSGLNLPRRYNSIWLKIGIFCSSICHVYYGRILHIILKGWNLWAFEIRKRLGADKSRARATCLIDWIYICTCPKAATSTVSFLIRRNISCKGRNLVELYMIISMYNMDIMELGKSYENI